jgi:uncharacterized protein YbcI
MENSIMLHNFSPADLEELIKKVVGEQLVEFRKNLSTKKPEELLIRVVQTFENKCYYIVELDKKRKNNRLWNWYSCLL